MVRTSSRKKSKAEAAASTSTPKPPARAPSSESASEERPLNIDISKYFTKVMDSLEKGSETTATQKASSEPTQVLDDSHQGLFISEDNLKGIIKDAIELALNNFVSLIKEELNAQSKQCIEKVEGDLHDIALKTDGLQSSTTEIKRKLDECDQNSVTAIYKAKKQSALILELKNSMNDLEQYTRRAHIRIHGVKEKPDETNQNLKEEITNLIQSGYGLHLLEDDIDVCHRLGRRQDDGTPRQVMVRFLRRHTKENLLVKRKHVNLPDIRVFHDLTQANSRLLYDVKRHNRIESAWVSLTGKIIAKGKNGHTFHVNLLTDIDAILNQSEVIQI